MLINILFIVLTNDNFNSLLKFVLLNKVIKVSLQTNNNDDNNNDDK